MSTISKRHIPTWELMASYYTFVPNTRDITHFDVDLRTLNPIILRDAISECVETKKLEKIPEIEQRRRIHDVYTRKIKEFSAIFPFMFSVENGLRSTLADYLGGVFGRMDWWTILYDARAEGKTVEYFEDRTARAGEAPKGIVRGVPVPIAFIKLIYRIFDEMKNRTHISRLQYNEKVTWVNGRKVTEVVERTDEFYYCLTLGELWQLIDSAWLLMRPMFCSDAELGYNLTRKVFNDALRVIKDARNELFHSNPIGNRSSVITCCAAILDAINFHLGDFDTDLGSAQYVRTVPQIPRQKRHAIPPKPNLRVTV